MNEEVQNENRPEVEKLILQVYEKAKRESRHSTKTSVLNYLAEQLSVSVSERTLLRYYQRFIENDGTDGMPNRQILDSLSQYLMYEDFADYCNRIGFEKKKKEPEKKTSKFKKIALGISTIGAIGAGSYFAGTAESGDCMIWEKTAYTEVACDGNYSGIYPLLPLDKNLMENFRKVNVDENTEFFEYGKPKIWYSKTGGKVEFFNYPGNHPATGKQLKPITRYMIDKYVLKK